MKYSFNKETLDLDDCTNKFVKLWWYSLVLGVLFLSSSILLIHQVTKKPKIVYEETILIDTFDISKLDTMYIYQKPTPQNVLAYLMVLGATHPYESCAQLCFESTYMTSPAAITKNNLGGFRTKKEYLYFPHWTSFLRIYVKWLDKHGLKSNMNYYQWLSTTSYHEADDAPYNSDVRSIEISLRKKHLLKDMLLLPQLKKK